MRYSSHPPAIEPDRLRMTAAVMLVLFIAGGIGLRGYLLFKYPSLWFDSDESNLGLMALHVLRQHKFQIFITRESYGGFMGVGVISLLTLLSGSPFLGIKLAALLFFVLFAVSLFALGRQIFNVPVALIGVALVCMSPAFLTLMGIRERGPHPESLFVGTLLMWVTCRLAKRQKISNGMWLGWGALAGLSWYTYYLAVCFIAPCALFLVINRRVSWKSVVSITAGALFGSLPYWVFVFKYKVLPPFDSTGLHFFDPFLGLKNFFLVGFPVLTGARLNFHREDLLPMFSKLSIFLYFGMLAYFFVRLMRDRVVLRDGKVLLAMQLLLYPLLFAFSSFAWFAEEPRYLIGLYAAMPLVAAWFTWELGQRSKVLAVATMLLLTGVSVYGSLRVPPDVFNSIFDEPDENVIRFLRDKGLKHFYANYWIVYRLMFETEEELIGANYFDITYERYPQFKQIVDQDPKPAYVAWESEAPGFEQTLRQSHRSYRQERIGRYVVFYAIQPRLPPK